MSDVRTFSSDELFDYLKILAKKFRKLNGKNTPAELYLVGGASILLKNIMIYQEIMEENQ